MVSRPLGLSVRCKLPGQQQAAGSAVAGLQPQAGRLRQLAALLCQLRPLHCCSQATVHARRRAREGTTSVQPGYGACSKEGEGGGHECGRRGWGTLPSALLWMEYSFVAGASRGHGQPSSQRASSLLTPASHCLWLVQGWQFIFYMRQLGVEPASQCRSYCRPQGGPWRAAAS